MFDRCRLLALLFIGLAVPIIGCSTASVTGIQISPNTETLAVGDTAQFTATATYTQGSHPSSNQNVSSSATWASSNSGVATISSSGVATAVAPGTTVITVSMNGYPGLISASAELTVNGSSSSGTGTVDLTSLTIIPGAQTVTSLNETTQFLAIGTYQDGVTVNLTNESTWNSSDTKVGTVSRTGLATALSQGTTTITAIASNADGSMVTGSATFTVASVSQALQSVSIIPGSQTITALNQTAQFIAIGSYGGSPATTVDLTNEVTWSSSDTSIATINSSGVATALSSGTATITAGAKSTGGSVVTGSATFNVSVTSAAEPLLSLTIIPSSQTVNSVNETGQFIALGTYSSAPTTRDVTSQVNWISSDPTVATINSAGVATGLNAGTTAITAIATNPDGTLVTGAATFSEAQTGTVAQVSTLTIYTAGANASLGTVTGYLLDSSGNQIGPEVIHCGPGFTSGSVCVGTFPLNATVQLTAAPTGSATFEGWSSNCTPTLPNGTPSNVCTVSLRVVDSVGAIFN